MALAGPPRSHENELPPRLFSRQCLEVWFSEAPHSLFSSAGKLLAPLGRRWLHLAPTHAVYFGRCEVVERLLIIGGLFVLAGLCEIGGGYLVWGWMREHKPLVWALLGALILTTYGVVAALQPISEFGRVYAAYGGIFIALALVWGIVVDGFRPDRWDLLGVAICVAGVVVMVAPPRG